MHYRLMISKVASSTLKRQTPKISMVRCFSAKTSHKAVGSQQNNSEEYSSAAVNYNSDIYEQLDQIQKVESLDSQRRMIELHISTKSEETMIDSELYSLLMNDIFERVHVAFDSLTEEN